MADWRDMVGGLQDLALKVFAARTTFDFEPFDGTPVLIASGGIFRAEHVELDPATVVGVSITAPTLDVKLADLPIEPRANVRELDADHVTIHFSVGSGFPFTGDVRFRISDLQPDGEGMATLAIHQVP